MKKESNLTKMLSTAGEKAAYDHVCKKLLANKEILSMDYEKLSVRVQELQC